MRSSPSVTRSPRRFTGRLVSARICRTDDPPRQFVADPGRYHLFAGWSSPAAHRSTLVLELAGLTDVVSLSYVDPCGPAADEAAARHAPHDGFDSLRRVYATAATDFDGPLAIPTLWDRATGQVVANDATVVEIDLATELRDWSVGGAELYPADLREGIDGLAVWTDRVLHPVIRRTRRSGPSAQSARAVLADALSRLDRRLARSRYLFGDRLTLADVRLWVTLVRYAPPPGPGRRIGERLSSHPSVWAYAQNLYQRDEFARTTRPEKFMLPGAGRPTPTTGSTPTAGMSAAALEHSPLDRGWPLGLPLT